MEKLLEWIKAKRGRGTELANALGVTPGAVHQWNKVPAERMGAVSQVTGIPLRELRPDIYAAAETSA